MERAAEKLRSKGMHCRNVTLLIRTSSFNDKEPYYGNQFSTKLAITTNDTKALLALIGPLLFNVWRNGHRLQKGGIILADFTSESPPAVWPVRQRAAQQGPQSKALMQVIDKINQKGLGKVYFGERGRDTSE